MKENNRYLYWYLGITFIIWWVIAGLFMMFSKDIIPVTGKLTLLAPIVIIVLYLPSIAGLIVYNMYGGKPAVKAIFRKLIPSKSECVWFPILFAVFAFFAFCMHFGSILFHFSIPKITYTLPKMLEITLFNFIKEVGLLGGIFGWIGFLLPFIQSKIKNNTIAGALTGLVFGIWVMPGYFIPSIGATTSYPLYVLQLMAFITFQSYIFNATRGNLLIYLFAFWLAATGSHIQLYYFSSHVQILEISYFVLATVVIHVIFKVKKVKAPIQTFPDFIWNKGTNG